MQVQVKQNPHRKRTATQETHGQESATQEGRNLAPPAFQLTTQQKKSKPQQEAEEKPLSFSAEEAVSAPPVQAWGMPSWLKKAGKAIGSVATSVGKAVSSGAKKAWSGAKSLGKKAWGGAKSLGEKAWSGAKSLGKKAWSGAKSLGKKAWGGAKALWSGAKSLGKKAWSGAKSLGKKAWSGAKSLGKKAWGGAKALWSGAKSLGKKAWGGIKKGAKYLWKKISGPKGKDVKPGEIPSDHILLEYAAHNIAYNPSAMKDPQQSEILERAGYDVDDYLVETGPKGFQAVLIMPAKKGLKPILAIRGTNDLGGLSTDLDFKQVGDLQYKYNLGKIRKMLAAAGQKVNLTGHSLGGAVSQIVAANHPANIGKLVTFQSPGISAREVAKFNAIVPEKRPEVYHHIANNDLVDLAGEANLPGDVYQHELKSGIDPYSAHTSYLFGTEGFKTQREDLGLNEQFYEKELGKTIFKGSPNIKKYKSYPHIFKRIFAETVRKKVGLSLEPFKSGPELIGRGLKKTGKGIKRMVQKLKGWENASLKGLKTAAKWAKSLF